MEWSGKVPVVFGGVSGLDGMTRWIVADPR